MRFPRIGFAKRLLLVYGVIFVLVLVMADLTLSHILQERGLRELQTSLTRQAMLIREAAVPLLQDPARLQARIEKMARETSIRITLVRSSGQVVADSSERPEEIPRMDNHATRPEIAAALKGGTGISTRYSMTLNAGMLYVAIPVMENSRSWGALRAALPIARVDEILSTVRRPVMLTALIGALIVLLAGIFFSNRLTGRIRRMTSVAERYARGDLSEKILIGGRDELKMLADTMNQMAASLRSKIHDLESEKSKISVILAHMREGVIAVDRRKQCVFINPAAEKIFGVRAEDVPGRSLIEITRHPQIEELTDRALREQKNASLEVLLSGKAKRTLFVSVIVLDASVRDIGAILVFHDRTELRRLENIRREFVANVSHELRTPLTSIKGFVETLLGGASKDPAAAERFLKIVSEETDRLGRLVEDILTLGEIEQGAAAMVKENIDLSSLLPKILEQYASRIQEKKLAVEDRIFDKPIYFSGDKDRVQQILINLIDNAIKFNKPGGKIILSAEQGANGVTITVEDTGVGIPEEAAERIFERFYRVDKARSKELGGTGLGLAIVKHIMEAHGGRITCRSTVGQGSSFSLFFPRS